MAYMYNLRTYSHEEHSECVVTSEEHLGQSALNDRFTAALVEANEVWEKKRASEEAEYAESGISDEERAFLRVRSVSFGELFDILLEMPEILAEHGLHFLEVEATATVAEWASVKDPDWASNSERDVTVALAEKLTAKKN